MARQQLTNKQLQLLRNDINSQTHRSPAFYFFNRPRIERFFHQNALALKVLQSREDELIRKYVQHDESGKPMTRQENGELVWVFATDELRQQYLEDQENILSKAVLIEV